MEDNSMSNKIAFAKNLNKLNFNSTLSIPIDTNVNIKNILDITSYLFDEKVECTNGKAIISGKIGLKVLYVDTDNYTNTLSTNQSFTETFTDSVLTADCFVNILDHNIVNNILSSDGILKVSCDISITPIMYLNLPIKNNLNEFEGLIVKKSEINTQTISNLINTRFDYTTNHEIKDKISKILYCNSYFCADKTTSADNIVIVEGKLYSIFVCEVNEQEELIVKKFDDSVKIKYDVNVDGLTKDDVLDLSFAIDKSVELISSEVEDENNVITVKHSIKVCGVAFKQISLDTINDAYSTLNDVELNISNREYSKKTDHFSFVETINNEMSLSNNEEAIEELIANLNILPEITNTYVKDDNLMIEGVICSNVICLNENKEIKQKQIESPFIINTKINLNVLPCIHASVNITDYKCKIKRGVIIETEYTIFVTLEIYNKENHQIVDGLKLGKTLDYKDIDFQIYLAKPNETMWDLCKRIKTSIDEVGKLNKDLPLVMQGGEKIIIKR